jgi:hypothetical protein
LIAALLGDHAKPALDQREILSVLAEQQRCQPIVIVAESDVRRGILSDGIRREKRSFVRP